MEKPLAEMFEPNTRVHAGLPTADSRLLDCFTCGYAHLWPLPSFEEVQRYYEDDLLYTQHAPGFLEEELHEYRQGLWDARFRHELSLLRFQEPLCDVGCGTGHFIDYAFRQGLDVYGSELSLLAREFMQPLIRPRVSGAWPEGCFKSIRLNLVLEHLFDPLAMLKACHDKLLPGGRLLVSVPNEFNPLQERVGGLWFVQKVHLNYFTPHSLRWLLERAGFKVVREEATFPMEAWILLGLDYRRNHRLGKACHKRRLRFERRFGALAFWLERFLYRRFGWGRELVFVAQSA